MSINDRRPPVVRGKWNRYLSQRVVLTAVLLFSGALCGFLLSRSSLAKINAQTTGYCDFFYTGPPISAAPIKIVFFFGVPVDYVCVPCSQGESSCQTNTASAYVNSFLGNDAATSATNFTNYSVDCGKCEPPPSPM